MTTIEALILGLVQGITEFLPVSSSAHLSLLQKIFGLQAQAFEFEILLHAATLLALIIYFRKFIWQTGYNLLKGDAKSRKSSRNIVITLLIAFLPLLPFYLIFKNLVDYTQSFSILTGILLIIFGIPLIFIESRYSRNTQTLPDLSGKSALTIGLAQCLALFSGVSRSGISIITGLIRGLDLKSAKEFAFLLSIPTIGASFAMELLTIFKSHSVLDFNANIILGTVAAFGSGLLALKYLFTLMKPGTLKYFGWYRIILGLVLIIWVGTL